MVSHGSTTESMKLYPDASDVVSNFLKGVLGTSEKYEREAAKYWDLFYKRNGERFFKDRHYLHNEWGDLLRCQTEDSGRVTPKVLLEVGCGVGNTIYPLLEADRNIFIHACDFSPRAVDLVKAHPLYDSHRLNVFGCDLSCESLVDHIPPHSVDCCTMIFVLSAISPQKMPGVLQNVAKVLKPGGHVLIRDYASGDLAQERLKGKEQKIEDEFYVRGDGTRVYYFSPQMLRHLFSSCGFGTSHLRVHRCAVQNRAKEVTMNRRWIQGTFILGLCRDVTGGSQGVEGGGGVGDSEEVELLGSELFRGPLELEERHVVVAGQSVVVRCLPSEHQHTVPQTGMMLWESSMALSSLLLRAPSLCGGKKVVELGAGGAALCSLFASVHGCPVVATDGEEKALELMKENLELNATKFETRRITSARLRWGEEEDIAEVVRWNGGDKFGVVLGADVVYVEENVAPMFQTAKRLLGPTESVDGSVGVLPLLLLCHVTRRVGEERILEEAKAAGFRGYMTEMAPRLGLDVEQVVGGGAVVGIGEGGRRFRLMCFTHETQ